MGCAGSSTHQFGPFRCRLSAGVHERVALPSDQIIGRVLLGMLCSNPIRSSHFPNPSGDSGASASPYLRHISRAKLRSISAGAFRKYRDCSERLLKDGFELAHRRRDVELGFSFGPCQDHPTSRTGRDIESRPSEPWPSASRPRPSNTWSPDDLNRRSRPGIRRA